MRLKQVFSMIGFAVLCACATPGFDYTARIAPGNPDAAAYRTVAVDRFLGPVGDWYADQFEEMLQAATFEGEPWFQVGLFSGQSNVNGSYYGTVEISRIAVRATPVLVDTQTEAIVHQATYTASDSEQECFETGHVEYRVRRGPNDPGRGRYRFAYENYSRPGYRLGSDHIIDRITASALRDTIWQARRDIAPYNREARARILTKSERPEVGSDPRFAEAVASVRAGDYILACDLFSALDADYPSAPTVLHNLGACAEASGGAEEAQGFYADAVSSARLLGTEPERRMLQALDRISETRSDEVLLNALVPPDS